MKGFLSIAQICFDRWVSLKGYHIQLCQSLTVILTVNFWSNVLNMHIFVFSASRSVRIDILILDLRNFRFLRFFNRHFRPEVDDAKRLFLNLSLVLCQATYTPTFKNRTKIVAVKNGGHEVVNYVCKSKQSWSLWKSKHYSWSKKISVIAYQRSNKWFSLKSCNFRFY